MYGFCPWVWSGRRQSPWVRVVEFRNDTTRPDQRCLYHGQQFLKYLYVHSHIVNAFHHFRSSKLQRQEVTHPKLKVSKISEKVRLGPSQRWLASSGSRVLHSPYCPLWRMYFFTHAECFRFFFSNKLGAPKVHAIVIKEPTTISVSSAIFKKVGIF